MILYLNSGALAEQFVGQQLLNLPMPWEEPEMHYWHREKRGSSAEVDYLISMGTEIIPVEVKAGKTGSLRSLHVFACGKSSKLGLRFNNDVPSATEVRVNTRIYRTQVYINLASALPGRTSRSSGRCNAPIGEVICLPGGSHRLPGGGQFLTLILKGVKIMRYPYRTCSSAIAVRQPSV